MEWLCRLFSVCMEQGEVLEDWRKACIIPIYKGKGDKMNCTKNRGISLLSIRSKVYGRVVVERVIACTESMIREEQCGFRQGRGCVVQVF